MDKLEYGGKLIGVKETKNTARVKKIFFFFKQKTAYEILTCDWSSDVCSSDLKRKTKDHPDNMCTHYYG